MDQRLNLSDLAVDYPQAEQEDRRRTVLPDRCFKPGLSRLRISEVKLIGSHPAHGSPEGIAEFERNRVLGEFDVICDWYLAGIVRREGRQVPIHEARETRVIARFFERDGLLACGISRRGEMHRGGTQKQCGHAYRDSKSVSHIHSPFRNLWVVQASHFVVDCPERGKPE
jgi:hypothetical protein